MVIFLRIVFIMFFCFSGSVSFSFAFETRETVRQSIQNNSIDVAHIDKKRLERLSDDERQWYDKFQNGLVFFSGWKDISEDILSCIDPDEQTKAKELLETMGIRIGTEWSKDNSVRKINTDQLQDWGNRLRQARNNGPQYLSATLKALSREVDSILSPSHE
jgi:hypothetical protein